MNFRTKEMKGKYGRWTIIEYSHSSKNRIVYWKCECECGTIRDVRGTSLRSGHAKSCGCLNKELTSKRMKNRTGLKHPSWKGGKQVHHGYVEISIGNGKYKLEHRMIVEKVIGRKLKTQEVIHHINGNKSDNKNCNLLVCSHTYHMWLHQKMSQLYMKEKFGDL